MSSADEDALSSTKHQWWGEIFGIKTKTKPLLVFISLIKIFIRSNLFNNKIEKKDHMISGWRWCLIFGLKSVHTYTWCFSRLKVLFNAQIAPLRSNAIIFHYIRLENESVFWNHTARERNDNSMKKTCSAENISKWSDNARTDDTDQRTLEVWVLRNLGPVASVEFFTCVTSFDGEDRGGHHGSLCITGMLFLCCCVINISQNATQVYIQSASVNNTFVFNSLQHIKKYFFDLTCPLDYSYLKI